MLNNANNTNRLNTEIAFGYHFCVSFCGNLTTTSSFVYNQNSMLISFSIYTFVNSLWLDYLHFDFIFDFNLNFQS